MPIPRVIIQTGKSPLRSPGASPWLRDNPAYDYRYFDDAACASFLGNHFGRRAVRAFWGLRPGAFKADLFRYAYLFVHGGVYIDMDCVPIPGVRLDDIIPQGRSLVAAVERRGIPGVWQAFLACAPGLPALRNAVTRICSNVESRWYPAPSADPWTGVLSITGPVLLASVLGIPVVPGHQDAGRARVFLYVLGDNPDCPVLDDRGRVVMRGTSAEHRRAKERYDVLVATKQAYW